jgi:hypothetical protein
MLLRVLNHSLVRGLSHSLLPELLLLSAGMILLLYMAWLATHAVAQTLQTSKPTLAMICATSRCAVMWWVVKNNACCCANLYMYTNDWEPKFIYYLTGTLALKLQYWVSPWLELPRTLTLGACLCTPIPTPPAIDTHPIQLHTPLCVPPTAPM